MLYSTDDVELVRKAQQGDQDSLNRLAETARVRLHEYVFRLTLDEDLTQDIVQETMLEMLRIFKKLRADEKFWGWLGGIAFNKVRRHYGKQWRRRTLRLGQAAHQAAKGSASDTLTEVVTDELKQIVLKSVQQLAPRYRAVLTLRCYDELSYVEIARLVGCSEIGARAMFYRAKKSLARLLADHGLGKGALLLALVAFGKMTAASKAAAGQVAVTGATLQVGPLAALLGTMTARTGLIALAASGTLVAGSVAIGPSNLRAVLPTGSDAVRMLPDSPWQSASRGRQECWYYFPDGGQAPVMVRLLEPSPDGTGSVCRILQNQYANYHYDDRAHAIRVRNCRAWKPDLSVTVLPTDDPELSRVLSAVQGRAADVELTKSRTRGLLVICHHNGERAGRIWRIDRHLNVLDEEYFHFSWPETTPVIDDRDAMHQRGWTYFQVSGRLGDRQVTGMGRLPFVHASAGEHYPWLKLDIGTQSSFVDTPGGAGILDRAGRIIERLPGGSFFQGLPRPWTGLHCIDTVRRDAAQCRLRFETTCDDAASAKVAVRADETSLVYTVDMETDVIDRLEFFTGAPVEANRTGVLDFVYLQEIPEFESGAFETPREPAGRAAASRAPGLLWLKDLATGR